MGRFDDCKPVIAMVGLQFIYAGVSLFTRAALVQGMNTRVFVVYRQGIATLIMAPLAYLSVRRKPRMSSLGLKFFAWISLASLIGITANQNAYFEGLFLTSSTATTAMTNLIPAITFVMAAIFGMEKVNIRNLRSIAKIIGTVICVTGAISMALLKGPKLLNSKLLPPMSTLSSEGDNWLLGCIFLFGSSCFWSFWMILQVPISESCPDHLYSSAWMGFLATIESAIIALSLEKNGAAWKLNSYLEMGCCLYAGVGLAVSFFLQAWCISQRGPLFSAMFNPLCTVITAIIAAIFLHEETYLGSLIGALAVIIGLYVVLWGKAKDLEEVNKGTHLKLQNDGSGIVQVIVDDESFEKKNCRADLEEPFISHKSANIDENSVFP
ncbi:Auxin-induced protein 5NG4, putative [Ricinus communis]|uniref:WAT1-related protein n=1 Tax=Ricinus communis TaxID=3988 RepID=B9SQE1_RICCO|nr:Auxin-induced protein 5NG4, putative [Ricinus communis]|eukprot:XP_002528210.1 WAT1-related protein At4g28040 [Ricinus communis]